MTISFKADDFDRFFVEHSDFLHLKPLRTQLDIDGCHAEKYQGFDLRFEVPALSLWFTTGDLYDCEDYAPDAENDWEYCSPIYLGYPLAERDFDNYTESTYELDSLFAEFTQDFDMSYDEAMNQTVVFDTAQLLPDEELPAELAAQFHCMEYTPAHDPNHDPNQLTFDLF